MISNSIYLLRTNLKLYSSNLTGADPGNISLSTAGGIHLELVDEIDIQNSRFVSLKGIDGGAINMLSTESFKELLFGRDVSYNLTNVTI